MNTVVTIGKRLIPLEHVAFVEVFDPATQPRVQSDKAFQTRIVLLDRDSLLTEEAFDAFVDKHRFRRLGEDSLAVNPQARFSVEAFEPVEGFSSPKPFRTRLMWKDRDGVTQSKLLLTAPETALAIAVRGEVAEASAAAAPSASGRSRRPQASSLRPA